ncbi:MAG: FAD-binding protein [Candidatus Thermoplasmatota archaeon]|nr:FAD-binding protein [Candidatus Thermoplasmatota archaeon]
MESADIGPAISPEPSRSPRTTFLAKEESPEGALHQGLARSCVSGSRIVSSSGERMLYSRDQSEIPRFLRQILFSSMPEAVVQAESEEGVLEVLRFASSTGTSVIPRGSGSSPFGGSMPVKGGIVLDVSRMNKIVGVDIEALTATVQTGVRWADLDHELGKNGLTLMTCPSSKFSTVGGWAATGGVGMNSFSRGRLMANVLSVELATPGRGIVRLTQADREFPLVFGSEGQLGVVTSATLQVRRLPERSRPRLVMFPDHGSALAFAEEAATSVRPVHIFYESSLRVSYTNKMLDTPRITPGDAVVVYVEDDASQKAFDSLLASKGLKEQPEYIARYVWNERFFPMKLRRFGPGMLGLEVVASKGSLKPLMSSISSLSTELDLEPMFEVHMLPGDEALLLCFFMADQGNTLLYTLTAFKSLLLTRLAVDKGATPYSVGIWNHAFSDVAEKDRKESMRRLKAEYDPRGVMNPGKYFRLSGRFGALSGLAMEPKLMGPLLRAVLMMSPLVLPVMHLVTEFSKDRLGPKDRPADLRTADECAMCGACVAVCPAYLAVGDERVTARGKLLTAKAMAAGVRITKEHAHRTFLCMRCKACEQVCQSKLELIPFYEELERRLERQFGRDPQEIERFVKYSESSPEYDDLVKRGLVIGAPKHRVGGGPGAL